MASTYLRLDRGEDDARDREVEDLRAMSPHAIDQAGREIELEESGVVGGSYFAIEIRDARGGYVALELVRAMSESEATRQMRNKHGDDAKLAIVGEGHANA